MTRTTLAVSSFSPYTTTLESPLTFPDTELNLPRAPETRSDAVVQWKTYFRTQDVPIEEGFEDIDAAVEERELDPLHREGLERARARLADKLGSANSPLATLRLRRGWSQKRLADEIGTSQPHVARIENGRDNVLLATANELARALNVSLEEVNLALGFGRKRVR